MNKNFFLFLTIIANIIFMLVTSGDTKFPLYLFISFFVVFLFRYNLFETTIIIFIFYSVSGLERYALEMYSVSGVDTILFSLIIFFYILSKKSIFIERLHFKVLIGILLFFAIYIIFGSINSSSLKVVFFLKNVLKNIFIFLSSIILIKSFGKERFLQVTIFLCIFIGLVGINEWLINSRQFVDSNYFYRSHGLIGNSNEQGQLLVLTCIPLIISLFDVNRKLRPALIAIYSSIPFIALVLTQSRGSLLTLVVIIILGLIFLGIKNKPIARSFLFLCFSTILVIISFLYIKTSHFVFWSRLLNEGESGYTNERYEALLTGMQNISILGIGIGNSSANDLNISSHNFYVHVLSENGLLFAPFFITLVFSVLFLLIKFFRLAFLLNENFMSIYILTTVLIFGFFTHNILYHSHYYFFIPLIVLDILNIRKIKLEKKLKNNHFNSSVSIVCK